MEPVVVCFQAAGAAGADLPERDAAIAEDGLREDGAAGPKEPQPGAERAAAPAGGSNGIESLATAEEVDVQAEVDQTASERDQTGSDADQTASDSDQTLSERDEAQSASDQLSSDRDQATADRDLATSDPDPAVRRSVGGARHVYELGRAERMAATRARSTTSAERAATASERLRRAMRRDATAEDRDRIAADRDRAAAVRDHAAEELEGTRGRPRSAAKVARDRAAAVRGRAAADRARAAADRERAASDRAAAAEERTVARLELSEAQAHAGEVIGQIAGGVAQSLNNVLGVVLLYAEAVTPSIGTLAQRQDLEQIVRAADRGSELTRQLRAYAGLGAAPSVPVEPSEAIRKLEPALQRALSAAVRIDYELEPGERPVGVDAAEFDHVLMNLILNAGDAMPDGGTVTVLSAKRAIVDEEAGEHGVEPGEFVNVTVSDTGEGMAPDVLKRIFEPFYTTKGSERTGLGLATVHSVVDRAGGWVDVQSAPGAGSTFRVTLPEAVPAAL